MRITRLICCLTLVLTLGACQRDSSTSVDTTATAKAAATLSNLDETQLRAAATRAIREQRIYSPAGDNAIELYVALRERFPSDEAARVALSELEPYAVIATEQSLQRNDLTEAARLIALIHAADPDASALPRLRDDRARREVQLAAAPATPASATSAAQATSPLPAVATASAAAPMTAPAALANPAPTAPVPSIPMPASMPLAAAPEVAAAPVPIASTAPSRTPALLRDATPRYPSKALMRGIEGKVDLVFTIEPDGAVSGARVVNATPAGLFEDAAITATKFWRFEATGQSAPGHRTVVFSTPKPAS
jgi:periplasmic protein TonB